MLKILVFENANISIATEILPVRNVQNNPDGQSAFYFMVSLILWSIWHWPDSKMCSWGFTSWPPFQWLMRGGQSSKDLHTFSDNKGTDRLEKGDWLPRARKREKAEDWPILAGAREEGSWPILPCAVERERGRWPILPDARERKMTCSCWRQRGRGRKLAHSPLRMEKERGRWPILVGAREEEEGRWSILPFHPLRNGERERKMTHSRQCKRGRER